MRIALIATAASLVTACSVVPQQAWTFDPTHPQPRPGIASVDAVPLTDRVAQLNIEKNEIRARIAAEPDARVRLRYYAQLHSVGRELSPLERRLAMYASSR